MRKIFFVILSAVFLVFSPGAAFSQTLSSSDLIDNAGLYDGKLVTFSGEAIGDIMKRGDFAWVNVSDGKNSLGVWMSASLAKEIDFAGSYKTRGDKIEIVGVFHRACPEHGGDLDIHACSLRKIVSGGAVPEKTDLKKIKLSIILSGVLFLIWILTLFKRK